MRRLRVVLTSFHGHGWRGSPRAMARRMAAQPDTWDVCWLTTLPELVAPIEAELGAGRVLVQTSPEGRAAMRAADVVVISHGMDDYPLVAIPDSALLVHSYHGLPTKRGELWTDDGRPASLATRVSVRRRFRRVDLFVSSSPWVSEVYGRRFGLEAGRFVETGYPDYDRLTSPEAPRGSEGWFTRRSALLPGVPASGRVVLYAPTFRGRDQAAFFPWFEHLPGAARGLMRRVMRYSPAFGDERVRLLPFPDADRAGLARELERLDAWLVLRPHPNERHELGEWTQLSDRFRVIDDRLVEDAADVLPFVDAVLTDYSGIALEGLLLDLPVVYAPYDIARWSRGFPLPWEQLSCGPSVATQAELVAALDQALNNPAACADRRDALRQRVLSAQLPNATDRLLTVIEQRARGRVG